MRTPHTHFKRGTPLRIILRDGRHIYDHYEDHGSGHILLREYGRLQLRWVQAVTIWKGGLADPSQVEQVAQAGQLGGGQL